MTLDPAARPNRSDAAPVAPLPGVTPLVQDSGIPPAPAEVALAAADLPQVRGLQAAELGQAVDFGNGPPSRADRSARSPAGVPATRPGPPPDAAHAAADLAIDGALGRFDRTLGLAVGLTDAVIRDFGDLRGSFEGLRRRQPAQTAADASRRVLLVFGAAGGPQQRQVAVARIDHLRTVGAVVGQETAEERAIFAQYPPSAIRQEGNRRFLVISDAEMADTRRVAARMDHPATPEEAALVHELEQAADAWLLIAIADGEADGVYGHLVEHLQLDGDAPDESAGETESAGSALADARPEPALAAPAMAPGDEPAPSGAPANSAVRQAQLQQSLNAWQQSLDAQAAETEARRNKRRQENDLKQEQRQDAKTELRSQERAQVRHDAARDRRPQVAHAVDGRVVMVETVGGTALVTGATPVVAPEAPQP